MLTVKMLILDVVGSRLYLRVDELGVARHLCYFLQYHCVMYCLGCVLAPGEGSVVLAKYSRCINRIDASLLEGLDDHNAGVLLVCLVDLLGC